VFAHVGRLSRLMVPCYFDFILRASYELLYSHSLSLQNEFIRSSSKFIHELSHSSIQLLSVVRNARLPPLSPSLREPRPNEEIDEATQERVQLCPSLTAGFSTFFCWNMEKLGKRYIYFFTCSSSFNRKI
jgi:hypothetical protein